MDDWTHRYPDVDTYDTQPTLLNQAGLVLEMRRARAQQAEADRVAGLEPTNALDAVGNPAESDVPLPFATPPAVALTF